MMTNVALGKQIATLNDFLKGASFGVGTILFITKNSNVCQLCKSTYHIATMCPHIGNLKLNCVKCGLPHKMEFYRMRRGYCYGMGHIEDMCWKHGKDDKTLFASNNYLKVLVNNEEATL